MSQRHHLVLQFPLTWPPPLPQESQQRHSGHPLHQHHLHPRHPPPHDHDHPNQRQHHHQVIVVHPSVRDILSSVSKQELFPINLHFQATINTFIFIFIFDVVVIAIDFVIIVT